jgi:hypothetical protein
MELKFVQGKRIREIADRLAMSASDLYRKQRVAIDQVALKGIESEAGNGDEEVAANGNVDGYDEKSD